MRHQLILLALIFSAFAEISRPASITTIFAGNSVRTEGEALPSHDLNSFISHLAQGQLSSKRRFGPIKMSVLYPRAFALAIIVDADLNNTLQINGANMNALRTNNAIFNFPRKVIDNSITITRSKIGQEDLIALADYTGGKIIPNGLLLNGISFTTDIEVEERFLDDLRRAYSILQQMHTLQELRPKGAFVQLILSSSFELPASKRDIARKVLLSAVEQSSDQLSGELNSWIISIIRTDFTNTQTLQTQTRPSNAQLSSKHELVHSRFNTPVVSHKNEDEEPEKQYVIGPPRKIVGSPEKQIFFWTFIFAIVLLGVVTACMWLMTVYEDPLIYLTGFVLEQDDPLKDDVI